MTQCCCGFDPPNTQVRCMPRALDLGHCYDEDHGPCAYGCAKPFVCPYCKRGARP